MLGSADLSCSGQTVLTMWKGGGGGLDWQQQKGAGCFSKAGNRVCWGSSSAVWPGFRQADRTGTDREDSTGTDRAAMPMCWGSSPEVWPCFRQPGWAVTPLCGPL